MRKTLVLLLVMVLVPFTAEAQSISLDAVEKALGDAKSLRYAGSGVNFNLGQSATPNEPWPKFNVKSYGRAVNYETASFQDELVRTQGMDPVRGGGGQPVRGEQKQVFAVSGDHAWNVPADTAVPAPVALAERQLQLWATPHGIVRAARARNATIQGRTIAFAVPGRFTLKATVDAQNLVERVDAVLANPVLGDTPVEIVYADYKDFGGVKFPTRIRQTAGGHPILDLTVTDVRANAAVDISVPDAVRQTATPYARVTTQMVADGVWYLTGGSHHSAVIEMKDHVIVVESPLNDERALAVLAETKKLVSGKPIRYLINSHHHFDHTGGVRAFAAEGAIVVTHEINRAFFDRTLAAPATVGPDHLAKSGKKPAKVEGVKDKRVMTDGARTVELHHIAGNPHHDGMLLVYLPKEKVLIEADAFTPGPANAPPPSPANPFNVNLADNITKLNLAVDQILPLHGRIVPLAELHRAIGKTP